MLIEKDVKSALEDYVKGRKVTVLTVEESGKMDAGLLSDFLENKDFHFLVDVPAYENPDFSAAVRDMTESRSSGEESPAPPHPEKPGITAKSLAEERKDSNMENMKKRIGQYIRAGMTNADIARTLGITESRLKYMVRKYGLTGLRRPGARRKTETGVEVPEPEPEPEKPAGHNADRHLCKTCMFRMTGTPKSNGMNCDYCSLNDHSRGCRADECTVYRKGAPLRKKKGITLNEGGMPDGKSR